MKPIDMRHHFKKYSDMRQGYFLNLRCDMGINKGQRYATLAFLKIDRRHGSPDKGPILVIVVVQIIWLQTSMSDTLMWSIL